MNRARPLRHRVWDKPGENRSFSKSMAFRVMRIAPVLSDTFSSAANLPFLHRRLHWFPFKSMGPQTLRLTKGAAFGMSQAQQSEGGICHVASNYRLDRRVSYYWYCDRPNRYLCPRACRDDSPPPRAPPSSP